MIARHSQYSQLPTDPNLHSVRHPACNAADAGLRTPAAAGASDRRCAVAPVSRFQYVRQGSRMPSRYDAVKTQASHDRSSSGLSRTTSVCVAVGLCALVLGLPTVASADFVPAPVSPVRVGTQPYWVAAADFNDDGQMDLVTANTDSSSPTGSVSVLLGQPGGSYTEEAGSPLAAGSQPDAVAIADFNEDNLPDMAVSNFFSDSVTILLREPDGGFVEEAGSPIPTGVLPHSVLAEDFNGDHRADLAIPDYGSSRLTILLRQPGGGFAEEAGSPFVTGTAPTQLAADDFNEDGRRDLAAANFGSGDVTILLRQADGGFEQEGGSPIPVGTHPVSPVAGDFNGDTLPDLAVTNEGSDTVTVLLRRPAGGFTESPGSPFAAGDSPYGLAAGNFGCDDRTDLAITNEHSGNVTILLGAADGAFTPAPFSPLPAGPTPLQFAAVDLNNDQLTDLAVPNYANGAVSILLQRCGSSPSTATTTDHSQSDCKIVTHGVTQHRRFDHLRSAREQRFLTGRSLARGTTAVPILSFRRTPWMHRSHRERPLAAPPQRARSGPARRTQAVSDRRCGRPHLLRGGARVR
jgi:hypothetical protein